MLRVTAASPEDPDATASMAAGVRMRMRVLFIIKIPAPGWLQLQIYRRAHVYSSGGLMVKARAIGNFWFWLVVD